MAKQKNNGDYGYTLQVLICDKYDLEVPDTARGNFVKGYNGEYEKELQPLCE